MSCVDRRSDRCSEVPSKYPLIFHIFMNAKPLAARTVTPNLYIPHSLRTTPGMYDSLPPKPYLGGLGQGQTNVNKRGHVGHCQIHGTKFGCIDLDSRPLLIDCTYQDRKAQGGTTSSRRVILSLRHPYHHSAPSLLVKWLPSRDWTPPSPSNLLCSISSRQRLIPPRLLSSKPRALSSVSSRSLAVLCSRLLAREAGTRRGNVCCSKPQRYVGYYTLRY